MEITVSAEVTTEEVIKLIRQLTALIDNGGRIIMYPYENVAVPNLLV